MLVTYEESDEEEFDEVYLSPTAQDVFVNIIKTKLPWMDPIIEHEGKILSRDGDLFIEFTCQICPNFGFLKRKTQNDEKIIWDLNHSQEYLCQHERERLSAENSGTLQSNFPSHADPVK